MAPTYAKLLEHLNAFDPEGPMVTGWTATPERGDGVGLKKVFDVIAYERSIGTMISMGFLADVTARQVVIDADLSAVECRNGDYVGAAMSSALASADAPVAVADAYERWASGRKTLIFTPMVRDATAMAEEFSSRGIVTEMVCGATKVVERRAILARFASGETTVVANAMTLTEGYDEPSVDCVIVARPTKSRSLFCQMVGRGTRIHPDKENLLVLDVVGATNHHDLVTTASLAGLDPDALAESSVQELLVERKMAADPIQVAAEPWTWAGELDAIEVDLLGSSRYVWLPRGNDWVLAAGSLRIVLAPDQDLTWRAVCYESGEPSVLAEGVDLELAQGISEDTVRAKGQVHLASREAGWRGRPATPHQLGKVRALGGRPIPGMSRGEASDLINTLLPDDHHPDAVTAKQAKLLTARGVAVPAGMTKAEAHDLIERILAAGNRPEPDAAEPRPEPVDLRVTDPDNYYEPQPYPMSTACACGGTAGTIKRKPGSAGHDELRCAACGSFVRFVSRRDSGRTSVPSPPMAAALFLADPEPATTLEEEAVERSRID
ncbi:MAG: helicase-related protein, partial [Acidimicrobiales bacterium]